MMVAASNSGIPATNLDWGPDKIFQEKPISLFLPIAPVILFPMNLYFTLYVALKYHGLFLPHLS